MPVNRRPLERPGVAFRAHAPARRSSVLLDGVNDSPEDARRLVRLLKGMRAKVNLIPFNEWEGTGFARPPLARILGFQAIVLEHGITATVRWSKGEDIGAACGQLNERVAC
jgi:23S rRNA (adenine2503-C2)-methyltransferase